MIFKGFHYEIDSSFLKIKIDNGVKPVYLFAKNQKDLKQFLNLLKTNNDKGTLKILKRTPGKLLCSMETWEDVYAREMKNLQHMID